MGWPFGAPAVGVGKGREGGCARCVSTPNVNGPIHPCNYCLIKVNLPVSRGKGKEVSSCDECSQGRSTFYQRPLLRLQRRRPYRHRGLTSWVQVRRRDYSERYLIPSPLYAPRRRPSLYLLLFQALTWYEDAFNSARFSRHLRNNCLYLRLLRRQRSSITGNVKLRRQLSKRPYLRP